jgi:uncharacterized RDD family membrane protein YckC
MGGMPGMPMPGMPMGAMPDGGPQFAEWPIRVAASIIDALPIFAVGIVIQILSAISSVFGLIGSVIYIGAGLYLAYLTGLKGASPGKRVMGIQVVNAQTGQHIGGVNGMVRSLAHIADYCTCGIGYLFPLWDKEKQTFADKIMKTHVILGPKEDFVTAFKNAIPGK